MGDAMTNDSEGRSLKPWTKVRDEMIINCEGYINPIQAAKEGFNAGRTDTLERMKKVREVLKLYAKNPIRNPKCNTAIQACTIGGSDIWINPAQDALSILEKELSDG